jgi:serine/threonine protein kinase
MPTLPQVGTDFAGYRLEAVIARTKMSVVYVAEHPRLGSSVALKVIAPEIAEDDRFRERFVRESKMVAKLRHPNVIPIHDAGPWHDLLYIAMLYVSGADLRKVLQQRGRLAPEQTILLLGQAGRALDAAHRIGLIHRDVKPGNMLIDRGVDDDPDHVYVSDFGITKQSESHTGLTMTGQFVGTIDYIAPEQVTGKEVDGRADLYSLGCVVYECVTGQTPFPRETEAAVIYAHMNDLAVPPSELVPGIPSKVDAVIARAMAKNPDERYETSRELINALADAYGLSGQKKVDAGTVISADIGKGVETKRSERQESGPIRDSGSVRRIDDGSGQQAEPFMPPQPPPLRRSRQWVWGVAALVVIAVAAGVGGWLGLRSDNPTVKANRGSRQTTGAGSGDQGSTGGTTAGQAAAVAALTKSAMAASATKGSDGAHGLLGDCSPTTPTAGAMATLSCASPILLGADPITLSVFPSLPSLYQAYEADLVRGRGSSAHNTGSCRGDKAVESGGGENAWQHSHDTQSYYADWQQEERKGVMGGNPTSGRVFCGYTGQSSDPSYFFESTDDHDKTLIVVHAGSSHQGAFNVWHGVHHSFSLGPMNDKM